MATEEPSFTRFPINPIYVVSMVFVMIAALVIYTISYFYQKSRGIPVDLASRELPPVQRPPNPFPFLF